MIALDVPLPGMLAFVGSNRIGNYGERVTANALEAAGYHVTICRFGPDLECINVHTGQITRVEVKTARRSRDKKWRFVLWKAYSQDHSKADVVVLLCLLKSGEIVPFVVPQYVLKGKSQACITSMPQSYRGYLSRYRQSIRCMSIEGLLCQDC